MSPRKIFSTAVLVAALLIGVRGAAYADMSKTVISAFRGQLVVSKQELPEGKNDKDTIAKIKKEKLTQLVGEAQEEVTYWNFHYTAFLSKTGSSKLKLEFYADGKRFVADKTLDGIDPKSSVLSGDISINEDEGLAKGKTYVVKLVAGKNTVVATTSLLMK
ncbi:MAG: hypothetical protein H0T89_06940 [Deltaproteobacteria bacterium]|nr:hypothetical protein [Deltaproteobacteria bacterium]MDQ3299560.1 hypothetical protein [Myxococcota bacterium]